MPTGTWGTHHNGLPYVEIDGQRRILACLPPPRPNMAAMPGLGSVAPVLSRSEWQECSIAHLNIPIYDQNGYSSCVGNSSAGHFSRSWRRAGGKLVQFSASYIYSFINGGRDGGAMISDAMDSLLKNGTCDQALCPEDEIYSSRISAEARAQASRFKAAAGYHIGSFDELCTAVILFGSAVFAVQVGRRFNSLDSDGCVGTDRGSGNHAVHADGLHRLSSGEWVVDMPNSWGTRWGNNGRGYVRQATFEAVGYQDSYCLTAAAPDPQDTDVAGPPGPALSGWGYSDADDV